MINLNKYKMKIKKLYIIFCKITGASAVMCLTFGIFIGLFFGIRLPLHEPIFFIAIPEIIMGLISLPYLIKNIFS